MAGQYTYGKEYGAQNTFDVEASQQTAADFSEKTVRLGFIRKVFGILGIQMLITFAVACPVLFVDQVSEYLQDNRWTLIVAVVMQFALLIVLVCCDKPRRKVPYNYILLFMFTIVEGFIIGIIAASSDIYAVLAAVGITTIVVFALSLFALQTKYDFTMIGGGLLVVLVALFVSSIIGVIFFSGNKIFHLVIACVGVILFSLYLIYDIQLMIGGRHKYSIGVDEYIFAALSLYLDIINIFLYILQIINISGDL